MSIAPDLGRLAAVLEDVQKRRSQSKRFGAKIANRLNPSVALTSDHFTQFEIEAVCAYFDHLIDQDSLDALSHKMETESKTNVQEWKAGDIEWQKKKLEDIETKSRRPVFFRHSVPLPSPAPERCKAAGVAKRKKVSAVVFDGRKETVLNENGEIPPVKPGKKPWSLTDVAETTDLKSRYWTAVQQNFLRWDHLKDEADVSHHTGNSVILSQNRAVSVAHVHQWMFWNLASKGTKLYLMYPLEPPTKKTKRGGRLVYNVKTPKLGLEEFMEHGTIGRISSELDNAPQFLIAPSFTSHHVITANRHGEGYWGSGGFGSISSSENLKYEGKG
mmetsp:Transcript_25833/g.36534  ORF Transcript_25833/g.36534 Transcript_25833/m.36534 type:complete len:330 (+) Transcript_25833:72-1061(+)